MVHIALLCILNFEKGLATECFKCFDSNGIKSSNVVKFLYLDSSDFPISHEDPFPLLDFVHALHNLLETVTFYAL